MKRPIGRPLKPRTDTERRSYLEKLLGHGRNRQDIEIWWDGPQLKISAGPMGEARVEIGAGIDIGSAIDHAISTHYRRSK